MLPSTSSPSPVPLPPLPPREKGRYAPLTPTPLNPNTYYFDSAHPGGSQRPTIHPPKRRKPLQHHPARPPQRYASLLSESPTQRLLRQKVLGAWRHHHVSSLSASAFNGPGREKQPRGGDDDDGGVSVPIRPVGERSDDDVDDGGERGIGLLRVDTTGRREDVWGCERQGCEFGVSGSDPEREGEGERGRVIGPVWKRWRYPGGGAAEVGGTALRRVLLVVAVFIVLGLVHGLVTAFAGGAVGVRPLAAGG
ncbi:hypothetical protein C8A03DRAFT_31502 [Achaetomium macrosporum]|uniref:Uncharacterized protein n=1 Tax=Achaetomium macrosporum TaxID=79813 RepID=A0AAN7CFZ1_9PEZI|nr:hypothetical protein C8A03DRAFT_31502 [Achaetomium macrosporum]